jgi:phage/plasmid-like protein (TIGR03299 family)
MSHEIENMFAVVKKEADKPWHGLGVELSAPPTVAEAIKAAGLDWTASKQPVYTQTPAQPQLTVVPDCYAVVRSSDGAILGHVGDRYTIVQNAEAFAPFQPMLDSGAVTLETAGSLRGGSRVWILGKCNVESVEIVPGDKMDLYVLFYHSHDGSLKIHFGFTPIRVVCNNTASAAIASDASKLIKIKHTKNALQALQAVGEIMNVAKGEFEATCEQYKRLAKTKIDQATLEKYVKIVFAVDQAKANNGKQSKVMDKIQPLYEHGRGNDLPGVKGTLWAAYNAVTEYLQHERGKDRDTRLDSTWFGQGAALNDKALAEALKIAA